MITAITLTAPTTPDDWVEYVGVNRMVRRQWVRRPSDLHSARVQALLRVSSKYAFFLDDDDALPEDYQSVLTLCTQAMERQGSALAYTDELQREPGGHEFKRQAPDHYCPKRHMRNSMLLHHLVLMDMEVVRRVIPRIPLGNYWTESLLYWLMAREGGAVCVPRIGYIWDRSSGPHLSKKPEYVHAQMRSRRWLGKMYRQVDRHE